MPFTPVHMGPGMLLKAVMPRYFSIIVFGLTQVALDLEVLWYVVCFNPPLHRFWHTYLGATVVAFIFTIFGKSISQSIKSIWNRYIAKRCQNADLTVIVETSRTASLIAAVTGVYSHILLDSFFHIEIKPMYPWSARNHFYGAIGSLKLHMLCLVLGVIGLVWFFIRVNIEHKKSQL